MNIIKKPSEMTELEKIEYNFYSGHVPLGEEEMFYPFRHNGNLTYAVEFLLDLVKQQVGELNDWKRNYKNLMSAYSENPKGFEDLKQFFESNEILSPIWKDVSNKLIVDQCFSLVTHFKFTILELIEKIVLQEEDIENQKEIITHQGKGLLQERAKTESLQEKNRELQSNLDQVVGAYHEQIWNS